MQIIEPNLNVLRKDSFFLGKTEVQYSKKKKKRIA